MSSRPIFTAFLSITVFAALIGAATLATSSRSPSPRRAPVPADLDAPVTTGSSSPRSRPVAPPAADLEEPEQAALAAAQAAAGPAERLHALAATADLIAARQAEALLAEGVRPEALTAEMERRHGAEREAIMTLDEDDDRALNAQLAAAVRDLAPAPGDRALDDAALAGGAR